MIRQRACSNEGMSPDSSPSLSSGNTVRAFGIRLVAKWWLKVNDQLRDQSYASLGFTTEGPTSYPALCGLSSGDRAGVQMPRHKMLGGSRDSRVIAKSWKPMNQRFLAEPGELALGVAALRLRNGFRGGSECDSSFKMRSQFVVPDEIERFCVEWHAAANES